MTEIWKDVVGYKGLYQVSNLGRVKSLPKIAGFRKQDEKQSAIFVDRHGYCKVNLYKNNTHKQCYVHILVATAFLPNNDNKPQVNHIDGDKCNNCTENLEWCTAKENVIHSYKTGLKFGKNGENHPMYGKHHSEETRKKIGLASKRYWSRINKNKASDGKCGL